MLLALAMALGFGWRASGGEVKMLEVTGKRLLILGGQLKMCDLVIRARQMGVYTIVTDWYETSPAKKIADKAYDVSISDIDAILHLIRTEKVDGVITGYIDSYLPHYVEICRRANLPCYLNKATLECSTNKRKFKDLCKKLGMLTIPEVDITDIASVTYPIVIKPSDNSGSKGITVCSNAKMIGPACERARRFSKSKQILIEKFMDCDYVAAHYIVRDGAVKLVMLMDKDMNRIGRGIVPYPTAYVSPSRYGEEYMRRVHPMVEKLVALMGMKNGSFLISFFVNGDNYYAVELAARLTATRLYVMSGIDTLEMYINYALTGEFVGSDHRTGIDDKYIYCAMLFFVKEGIIGRIEGVREIAAMSGVLNVLQLRDVGAKIRADGSYGQLFFRAYLKAESMEEVIGTVEKIHKTLRVYSTEESPMLIAGFDARRFFQN